MRTQLVQCGGCGAWTARRNVAGSTSGVWQCRAGHVIDIVIGTDSRWSCDWCQGLWRRLPHLWRAADVARPGDVRSHVTPCSVGAAKS
jgi:hypothetical protein